MKYFSPPFTEDHIREQFRTLSKKLHPDKGGSEKDFQEMVEEKDQVESMVKAWRSRKRVSRSEKHRPKKPSPEIIINLDPQLVRDFLKYFFNRR